MGALDCGGAGDAAAGGIVAGAGTAGAGRAGAGGGVCAACESAKTRTNPAGCGNPRTTTKTRPTPANAAHRK